MLERSGGYASLLALLAVAGCATVDPQPDFQQAARYVTEVTGEGQVYRPGADEEVISENTAEKAA